MTTSSRLPRCRAPNPAPRPAVLVCPPGACDTHAHVLVPGSRYPLSPRRGYEPPDAPLDDYLRLLETLGIERAVLVQPSAYATDNTLLLDCLSTAPDRLRGVAAAGPDTPDRELERLHAVGVRGLRINLADPGGNPFREFGEIRNMAERIRDFGWHLEFLVRTHEFENLYRTFTGLCVDCVFGHFGFPPATAGTASAAFQALLRLLKEERCWVKLTAAYRISTRNFAPYADVHPLACALLEANPYRLLWGSDWPHVHFYRHVPDDAELLDDFAACVTDAALRRRILVDNPARLYGFATP